MLAESLLELLGEGIMDVGLRGGQTKVIAGATYLSHDSFVLY
jgi:hypothetical protein